MRASNPANALPEYTGSKEVGLCNQPNGTLCFLCHLPVAGANKAIIYHAAQRLSGCFCQRKVAARMFEKFAELVAAKTNGRVDVQIFPSATLHGWSEGVDAVNGGVSDISWIPADKRLPCYRVTSLYPAAVNLDDQIAMDVAYADLIRAEAAKANLVPLFNSNYSYDQEWWFKTPGNLGNLNGKLVRSIGPLVSMMIEEWGGKPVFIAPKKFFSQRSAA